MTILISYDSNTFPKVTPHKLNEALCSHTQETWIHQLYSKSSGHLSSSIASHIAFHDLKLLTAHYIRLVALSQLE